uniref:Interleukin 18 n=1 Tax=Cyclopterus lumpus TaxID=8103 RepID=A0A8C3A3Y8_CYCLU
AAPRSHVLVHLRMPSTLKVTVVLMTITHVVDDSFNISKHSLPSCWVQSKDNKFLLLNSEHQFQVQNLTSQQLNQPECKFKIQIYFDFERGGEEKRNAAMLYVKSEGKNVVACCSQEHAVHAEDMVLPIHIEETHHKALFYMTELTPSHTYEFESSAYPSRFLGFEPDGCDPSLVKLVLHEKAKDEVDESCHVILCR